MGWPVDEVPRVPPLPKLKRALAWLLNAAALGPFVIYLILTCLSHLLDDE